MCAGYELDARNVKLAAWAAESALLTIVLLSTLFDALLCKATAQDGLYGLPQPNPDLST